MLLRASFLFLLVAALLWASSGAAQTSAANADTASPESPDPLPVELGDEFFDRLEELKCTDLNGFAYREIPRYVLADRPDLVYELVLYWESRCLSTEPVFRIRLLGSIWDGEFDEGQYEEEVIDRLIERYDPPVESRQPELRKKYDEFTVTFADQLLPHVPRDSVEEFLCLYYSGKTEAAWDLLNSDALEDTWLRYYYDEDVGGLSNSSAIPTFALTTGLWFPRGNVAFVGDKPMFGFLGGVRWPHWLVRLSLEWRIGRSDEPYFVDEEIFTGRSNRFNATLIGLEFGRILLAGGRSNLDLFVGVGTDMIRPFNDYEDLYLTALNFNAGLGYRLFFGGNGSGALGLDLRREWIGERNEGPYSMSGGAWSIRLTLGFAYNKGDSKRLKALGQ